MLEIQAIPVGFGPLQGHKEADVLEDKIIGFRTSADVQLADADSKDL